MDTVFANNKYKISSTDKQLACVL